MLPFLFFAMFVLLGLGPLAYRMVKYGGFKGAMFGARIDHTVGEAAGASSPMTSVTVRIHALKGDSPGRAIGMEIVTKGMGYHMMPVTLSVPEASKVAMLLQSATTDRRGV